MFRPFIPTCAIPEHFRTPFAAMPHPAAIEAAEHLQLQLEESSIAIALRDMPKANGKMFGVLLVRSREGEIGYLSAFSGKLGDSNHHPGFVPPVFDVLQEDGFFKKGEAELNEMNHQITKMEQHPDYIARKSHIAFLQSQFELQLQSEKARKSIAKQLRKERRIQVSDPDTLLQLETESKADYFRLRDLKRQYNQQIAAAQAHFEVLDAPLRTLRTRRAAESARLQESIFEQYKFLNAQGQIKHLRQIFHDFAQVQPPAGAGECAAPKLLNYAYLNDYQPLAIAEFWWGAPTADEVRKHKQFYPSCRSKCHPILSHMLVGLHMEPQPQAKQQDSIQIVHEDKWLAVIEKPTGILSVPGKETYDSVWLKMQQRYPTATGPIIVHRLDQATSGLMLIAKTEQVYKQLQRQFAQRNVQKRYIAILDGIPKDQSGNISLPLRVDLDDRPRQMVCHAYGKSALTQYQIIRHWHNGCLVEFTPVTGRTHQLRVHAAHPLGLNAPIKGDDLYGTPADRLYLHAAYLAFTHPITDQRIELESPQTQVFLRSAPPDESESNP